MSDVSTIEPPRDVHVAVLRTVRVGREAEFEARIAEFFGSARREAGVRGAYLIRPMAGGDPHVYGILRSFRSEEDMRRFYDSELFRRWDESVGPLVQGAVTRHRLHGLEAFFRGDGSPPAWKMALVTWIGVNVAVYVFSNAVPAVAGALPPIAELLVVNALVVAALTWVIMPLLTRLFRGWLRTGAS